MPSSATALSYTLSLHDALPIFFFKLSSVANSSQVASGLPVGCNIDAITNFPFTLGNHLAKLIESLIFSGNKITSAVTPFFEVDGLQANCIPYNDCTRGETISICEMPRSHALHSPHCWFSASIPQLLYLLTTQWCDASISGVPTKRGPI